MFGQAKKYRMGSIAKYWIAGHLGYPDIFFHLLNSSRARSAPCTGCLC
jgi:hypothetical protein